MVKNASLPLNNPEGGPDLLNINSYKEGEVYEAHGIQEIGKASATSCIGLTGCAEKLKLPKIQTQGCRIRRNPSRSVCSFVHVLLAVSPINQNYVSSFTRIDILYS